MAQARTTTTESFVDNVKQFGDDLWNAGARVFHAGVGVVATTEEQARETFERLVDKGKAYESDEERLFSRATREAKEFGQQFEHRIEKVVSGTLNRAGVPSRDEINQLTSRVEALTNKVDEIASK